MKTIKYHKLVRDRIPEIIEACESTMCTSNKTQARSFEI